MKIALGTVQFGLNYGVANNQGKVNTDIVKNILIHAKLAGIDTLDTASIYGNSEDQLGEIGVKDWRIVTKLSNVPNICDDISLWVREQVFESMQRLKVRSIAGFLLHDTSQLIGPYGQQIWSALKVLKDEGVIEKIGFSIYNPNELEILWESYKPDLVQAPYNIFDRRLEQSGWLQVMSDSHVEVHIRSVFLQGLLLMSRDSRPTKFNRWSYSFDLLEKWIKENNTTALQACLSLPLNDDRINKIVIGVDNTQQLQSILSRGGINTPVPPLSLCLKDVDLINPSHWNSL
jgi:aryl-alcohol dehydrogenase-like predicted oxidoreductase